MKPERSWREAGAAKGGGTAAGTASAKAATSAGPAARTVSGSKKRASAGPGDKVWPSTQGKGRSGDPAYAVYDELLEATGSGNGKGKEIWGGGGKGGIVCVERHLFIWPSVGRTDGGSFYRRGAGEGMRP